MPVRVSRHCSPPVHRPTSTRPTPFTPPPPPLPQVIDVSAQPRVVIGRAEGRADVHFDGTPTAPNMVSRAHAALTCTPSALPGHVFDVEITDLHSVNGILVNGTRVRECTETRGLAAVFFCRLPPPQYHHHHPRGMYDTWISGSDVNSFCCYGSVYLLDSR
jgi:pSer/pThr/pTyr-binding forkhead associated (FHA) protein